MTDPAITAATGHARIATAARIQFAMAALAVCGAVTLVAWLSDVRAVFHGTIIALSVAAFLPLFFALAIILVFLGMSIVAVVSGDPEAPPLASDAYATSEGLSAFFRRVFVPYYRFLFTRRNPVLLGAACGLLLGSILVWVLLSRLVLPGEVCTLKRMATIQGAIEKRHYPSPLPGQRIDHAMLGDEPKGWPFCAIAASQPDGTAAILLDGFGRPLTYRVAGHWPLTSYQLSSLGYDGKQSSDDLCLGGRSRVRGALDLVGNAAETVHDLLTLTGSSANPGLHRWWSALRAATCPPDARGNP